MFNILKWLGVLPAADGLVGHICFILARHLAASENKLLVPTDADRSRMIWFRRAFILLLLFLLWTYFPVPEDFSRPLIEWRWRLAAALYVLFYVALGKSEPHF